MTDALPPPNENEARYRTLFNRPGIKILLITGYAEIAVLGPDGMESGMEVMTKPFEIDELGPRVKRLLES